MPSCGFDMRAAPRGRLVIRTSGALEGLGFRVWGLGFRV